MIFKNLNRVQLIFFIALSFVTASLFAEVSVNNIENNDKVTGSELATENVLLKQSSNIASDKWELRAEQWEMARSGESILSLPVLNRLVNTWLRDKQKKIEIQYPGGEEGEFWVQELNDWLVSLGIPSDHMILVPGSGADDMIRLNLIK